MKYMLLIYGDPTTAPAFDSPEWAERNEAWMAISAEMAPVVESGAALHPVATATTVRGGAPGGEPVLTDGPFAETKEVLGGFYVIDVPDLDTALGWAARMPHLPGGSVEVRPVIEMTQV